MVADDEGMEFPGRLRALRSRRGWSREQAAERIGIAAETLARFERAERRPSLAVLLRLSKGYGVSVDELTGQVVAPPAGGVVAECTEVLSRLDERRLRLARELLLALERAEC